VDNIIANTRDFKDCSTYTTGYQSDTIWGTAEDNVWELGAKKVTLTSGSGTSTGDMDCQTCHVTHATNDYDAEDLVFYDNRSAGDPTNTDNVQSYLCEVCHTGGNSGAYVGIDDGDHPMDGQAGRAFRAVTDNTHIPSLWLQISQKTTGAAIYVDNTTDNPDTVTPRCSTCHDTHGGMAGTSLLRPTPGTSADGVSSLAQYDYTSGTNPQTAAINDWCWSCHGTSGVVPTVHHSNTSNWSSSAIDCSDCHGNATTAQSIWSAHNGFGLFSGGGAAGVSADTNPAAPGIPTGTGDDFAATSGNQRTYQNLCESCHDSRNPTVWATGVRAALGTAGAAFTNYPSSHDAPSDRTSATGSHLVSEFKPSTKVPISDTTSSPRTYNSYARYGQNSWDNAVWGVVHSNVNGYAGTRIQSKYARYGSGTPQNPETPNGANTAAALLICESCHNLLTNAGEPTTTTDLTAGYDVNLLVMKYEADATGTQSGTGSAAVYDNFCRGCHNSNQSAMNYDNLVTTDTVTLKTVSELESTIPPANGYVHYPAAHTSGPGYTYSGMGYPLPYGRSTDTILNDPNGTCIEMTTADNNTAPGVFSYPNDGRVSCDSCHRPHNADADSVDYDLSDSTGIPGVSATYHRSFILRDGTLASGEYPKEHPCAICHNEASQCN
jgi:hypothetical protein